MRRSLLHVTCFAFMIVGPGCSLIVSTEDARGIPAPDVSIEPATPTTTDGLRAVVDESGVAIEGLTYEYAWFVDGSEAGTSDAVDPTATTKGQVWTVRVTPRLGDRVGTAREASVTIANSPPRVTSIGLSNYRPITVDVLRAFPTFVDDDGDDVTLAFRWMRDGVETIGGEIDATIDLAARSFAAGESVHVVVTPSDGDGAGEPAASVLVPVAEAETGWRQIAPKRRFATDYSDIVYAYDLNHFGSFYDDDDERLVTFGPNTYYHHGVWESPVDGPRRYVRLPVEDEDGPTTFEMLLLVHEPASDVVYGVGYDDGYVVYRLDLDRGRERRVPLTAEDGDFESDYFSSAFLDEARNRLVLYQRHGTIAVHALEEGSTWVELTTQGTAPEVVGGAWLHEPGSDVAYLVGGAPYDVDSGSPEHFDGGLDSVAAFDLVTSTWSTLPLTAPAPVVWPAVAVDPASRVAYLIDGAEAISISHVDNDEHDLEITNIRSAVWTFDFETLTFDVVSTDPGPIPPRMLGAATWHAPSGRVLHTSGIDLETGQGTDVIAIAADGTRTAIDVVGVHVPAEGSYATIGSRLHVLVPGGTSFRFVPEENRFEAFTIADDPEHGAPAAGLGLGRYAAPVQTYSDYRAFVGTETWRINGYSSSEIPWQRLSDVGPAMGSNGSFTTTSCDLLFGIDGASLWKASGSTWSDVASDSAVVPGAGATIAVVDGVLLAVGIDPDAAGDPVSIWSTEACPTPSSDWTAVPATIVGGGAGPSGDFEPLVTVAPFDDVELLVLDNLSYAAYAWELRHPDGWEWDRVEIATSDAYHPYGPPDTAQAGSWDAPRRRLVVLAGGQVWELRYPPTP